MMKKIFLFLLFGLSFLTQIHGQYFSVDTLKLNSAYRALKNNSNTLERQKIFFNAFPSNWNEFIMTYQYLPDKKYDLSMYHLSSEHINMFEHKLTLIKDTAYCAKVINLALGAQLDSDAPNELQQLQHHVMWNKMETMMKIISRLTDADQMRYWQFYWSSLNKKETIETEYNRLHKLLVDEYPNEMKTMGIAFNYFCGKSIFQSDNHIGGRYFKSEK